MKGRRRRWPWSSGASSMTQVPAKRQSMPAEAQSCPTDRSESVIEGTHRTPERVKLTVCPRSSLVDTCMSPIATQRCGAPSTPRTDVPHAVALCKSAKHG
eukprot:3923820-Pleurochrysis_carterae.AAC.1